MKNYFSVIFAEYLVFTTLITILLSQYKARKTRLRALCVFIMFISHYM